MSGVGEIPKPGGEMSEICCYCVIAQGPECECVCHELKPQEARDD